MFRLAPVFQRLALRSFSAVAAAQQSVSKEALKTLRQRTGYSYLNCRKAILQFGENNLDGAEKYLHELADKEGWEKAEKVGGRETTQGLVSVYIDDNIGAVVELKSETDFVARNNTFKELLEEITEAVHEFGKHKREDMVKFGTENFACRQSKGLTPYDHIRFELDKNIDQLPTAKNRNIKEAIAMTIGRLKENIVVARAEVHLPPPGYALTGHAHPAEGTSKMEMGRFVSLLSLQRTKEASGFPTEKLAQQLCQHVIGMNPQSLGSAPTEEEEEEKLRKAKEMKQKLKDQAKILRDASQATELDEEDDENDDYDDLMVDEDENQMLRQAFMLNPSQTVHDYLTTHGAQLSAFVRIKLGEKQDTEST